MRNHIEISWIYQCCTRFVLLCVCVCVCVCVRMCVFVYITYFFLQKTGTSRLKLEVSCIQINSKFNTFNIFLMIRNKMLFYLILQENLNYLSPIFFFCIGHVAESLARFFINSSTTSTIFIIWSIYLLSVNAIECSSLTTNCRNRVSLVAHAETIRVKETETDFLYWISRGSVSVHRKKRIPRFYWQVAAL